MSAAIVSTKSYIKNYRNKIQPLEKGYKYLTTAEYGEILSIKKETVQAMCRGNGIIGVLKIGKEWRIPVKA